MERNKEDRNRPLALILTIVFHGLLLIAFLLIVLKTPIPPYPTVGGGGGLEVNFGTSANGMGSVQPEQYIPIDIKIMNQQTARQQTTADEGEVMTQQVEEAPVIKTGEIHKKKKVIKKEDVVVEKEVKKATEIVINDPVVNPLALYKKKPKGASEGETGKPGDQGNPNGDITSKNHYGEGGSGGGTGGGIGTGNGPGIGSGSGPGIGTGVGAGGGRGISYSLSGRKHKYLPAPSGIKLQHQEIVVISIWVDRAGNVTKVNVGEKGTTTLDHRLLHMAEEYASKSKFDSNPMAAEIQKGTITYIFTPANQ